MEHLADIIYIITLILLIIFNIYIYHAIFSSKFGKYPPYVPTDNKRRKIVIDKISQYLENEKTEKIIYDAGSGTGDILIPLAKKFPEHKFIGIEWSLFPYLVAKIKSRKLKNIELIKGDIFKQNFNDADIIYCYAVAQFEKMLSEKLIKEINQNCLVVTNGHLLPDMKIIEDIKIDSKWMSNSVYVLKK